jgi:polyphosphate kinase 2
MEKNKQDAIESKMDNRIARKEDNQDVGASKKIEVASIAPKTKPVKKNISIPPKVKLTEGMAHRNLGKQGDGRVPVYIKQAHLDYEAELKQLQLELMKLQLTVKEKGLRVVMLFEGRDAAGKGGTIKRIIANLNVRGIRVVALDKPNDQEKTQWYFQRYVKHLPSAGEIVIFDRSWYNRAMVEPVMDFCTDEQHKRFLKSVPMFEAMLIKDGIDLFKFYFSVSKKEQKRRFKSRETNLLKQYKLSPVDKLAQEYWHRYSIAKFQMLNESNRTIAPWTIIRSDNKKKARINCIKHILLHFDYENKVADEKLQIDAEIVVSGIDEIQHMEDNLMTPKNLHG